MLNKTGQVNRSDNEHSCRVQSDSKKNAELLFNVGDATDGMYWDLNV